MHDMFGTIGKLLGGSWLGREITSGMFYYAHPSLHQEICDIRFPNPVGLSAGFDKDIQLPNII
ncbi:hypothetical protein KA013_00740 [Patescibacteria group bacterium]|nr:hypothetical protein [Patescibacteria group bacterium]